MADRKGALLVLIGNLPAYQGIRDQCAGEDDRGDHGDLEQQDLGRKLAWSHADMLRRGGGPRITSETTRTTGRTE
jgi:hypothetical protein